MSTNQKKPLTSILPANASAPLPAGAPPKPDEWDEYLAAEVGTEIFPDADKPRQTPTTHEDGRLQTSPDADKHRQTPTTDFPVASVEPTESAPDPGEEVAAPPIFRRADDVLVHEIAMGTSLAEAARRAGVSGRTAERRWKDDDFREKVLATRAGIRWELAGRMTQQAKQALAVLFQGLSAKSESVRVSAARSILKLGQEIGGRQEENALLARQLKEVLEALDRTTENQQE